MLKHCCLLLFLFVPFLLSAPPAANAVTLTASVNKTVLTTEDELLLTVTVDGATGDFTPQLPSMPSFNIYGSSIARQIINSHATTTFEYVMLPRFAGKTVIAPITLNYAGQTYKTDPITVTVYRAGSAPNVSSSRSAQAGGNIDTAVPVPRQKPVTTQAPADMPPLERSLYNLAARHGDKDYFMVAAVSNNSPYVNQTVILAVRFYFSRLFAGNAPYSEPAISNLFMEPVGSSEGRQTISGKTYSYIERRYAVSGVTAGPAKAGEASVKYTPMGNVHLSVFDRMFAAVSQEPKTVKSNPLSFTIRPTPLKGKPKSFYGAVGSGYSISASIDRSRVEAGEAVNLTVNVNGPGNLKPTADLKLPALPGFKVYDVASNAGSVPNNGTLKSYKIFKTVIVPVSSGNYTIPALDWSYFDPTAKAYRTIRTKPLEIEVTPSSKTDTGFDFGAQSDLGNGFRQLGQDIRYLKSDLAQENTTFLARLAKLDIVSYLFAALLLAAGVFALMDKQTLAGKRALSRARAQLKKAKTEEAVSDALSVYLQVRYGVHTASLPLRDISAALKKRGCPPELIKHFESLWQHLDAARFAPAAMQRQNAAALARQAEELMKKMDKGSRL